MKTPITAALLMFLGLASCTLLQPGQPRGQAVDFVSQVKPMLESRCLECHHRRYVCAGLNLETKTLAIKGGRSGPVIIPGAPHQSLLYKVLRLGHDNPVSMPPTPESPEPEEIQLLHDWIQQGAQWPADVRLVPPQDWKRQRSS